MNIALGRWASIPEASGMPTNIVVDSAACRRVASERILLGRDPNEARHGPHCRTSGRPRPASLRTRRALKRPGGARDAGESQGQGFHLPFGARGTTQGAGAGERASRAEINPRLYGFSRDSPDQPQSNSETCIGSIASWRRASTRTTPGPAIRSVFNFCGRPTRCSPTPQQYDRSYVWPRHAGLRGGVRGRSRWREKPPLGVLSLLYHHPRPAQ